MGLGFDPETFCILLKSKALPKAWSVIVFAPAPSAFGESFCLSRPNPPPIFNDEPKESDNKANKNSVNDADTKARSALADIISAAIFLSIASALPGTILPVLYSAWVFELSISNKKPPLIPVPNFESSKPALSE